MQPILFDFLLFVGLVAGTALGYHAGVVKRVFDLGIVLATVVVVALFLRPVGAFCVNTLLLADPEGYIVAMLLLIGLTVIPSMIVYHRFDRTSSAGEASRFFGGIFGLFEGALVLSMLLACLNLTHAPSSQTRDESLFYRPIAGLAPGAFTFFVPLVPRGDDLRAELSRMFLETPISRRAPDPKEKL
ncbi:MAG: CvpA family protein [Ignavibacteria bacterium]|nr:CvpA family protein [Ignavibacteria bacterium]